MLFQIFSDPNLLVGIRSGPDSVIIVNISSPGEVTRTLDITSLKTGCLLLISTFQEVLRFTAMGTSVREVLEDTVFDNQWHLEKGPLVQMPIRCLPTDQSLRGSDVDDVNPRRFIKGEKQNTPNGKRPNDICFRTFGGESHLCSGRHFAVNKILAITSMDVSCYDFKPSNGEWERPSILNTNTASTLMEPVTDINVKTRRRIEYEKEKWKITLTREVRPSEMVAEDVEEG